MERKTVIQAIQHWAQWEPKRVAVSDGQAAVCYADFWQRVQSVAAILQEKGCGREDRVVVYVRRSVDAIVAIYAALACGSAFVPVDPTAGRRRITYILENCEAKAILTAGEAPETDRPIIDVRQVSPAVFCPPERRAEDLAYVIYTSGTTGVPKGVMIEDGALLGHLDTLRECFGFAMGHTIPLLTSHCFDFAIPMVFSLCFGMTLRLFPDAIAMGEYLAQGHLDYLKITPSHFMAAADLLKPTVFGKVAKVIFGGEAVTELLCVRAREIFGSQVRIFNEYGPTEATVFTTLTELKPGQPVSIGRACSGSTAYVLDGERLCAPYDLGELCFAGPNLARGYLADAEKTAKSFPTLFGVRLYRTGDLGYMDEDGVIFYAGRQDKQVKIRGYRVEPEEVAEVLCKQKNVTDAAVIAVKTDHGEQELHAYLVGSEAMELSEIEVQLREELPDYMIPAAMVRLSQIPLTPNGKLDERALPEIRRQRSFTAPRNEREKQICALFGELLSLENVGIEEDFFVLGGNSLKAMSLLHRLRTAGFALTMGDIFACPTVKELSAVLDGSQREYTPIPAAEKREDYPLSPAQEQMYWLYQLDPENLSYHMPWLVELEEGVKPEDIRAALQSMTDRHEILRTRFTEINGQPRQVILPRLEIVISVTEEQTASPEETIKNFLRPFVLEKPPLFRVSLLKRERGWLLLTDMHHIIRDGLSRDIFIEEYTALREGKPLPQSGLQYRDYCLWMESRDIASQGAFWREQYHHLPEPLELPTDFPRPRVRTYQGSCVRRPVPPALRESLRNLTKQTNTTDYMVFLAGAMILLGQYSRQEDVVIGSPLSGRTHEDLGRTLGIFMNSLPMRGYPKKDKTLGQFLGEIRSLCVGAYQNQEYPLAKIVEEAGVVRESSRNPLYDVILVLQNREKTVYSVGGKTARRLPFHLGKSKVDLTFQILESEDQYEIELEYSTELFRDSSAERMLEHYLRLLAGMENALELPLGRLLPLSDIQREQVIKRFNPLGVDSIPQTAAQRFFAEATAHPDIIALRDGARQWSFGHLRDRVIGLAARLKERGLGEGKFAVLLCRRSMEYILGVLAVLHCGGAFVPVDPEYPEERIQYILRDSGAVLALTHRENTALSVPTVSLTEAVAGASMPPAEAAAQSPAYMIYTSGTTGKPKGVIVPNRALAHYISYAGAHYRDPGEPLEVALFSSISFDLTITSTFLGLLFGGTTTVYSETADRALARILRENRTTFLKLTPAHLKMMEELPFEGASSLRHMVLGGEALPTSLAKAAQNRYGKQLVIHNEYGPTEATVGCCDYCYDENRDTEATVSIGRPMDHARIYILRDDLLCPIGMPGELCIAGEGVALGYQNQKELTEKVFVPDPFGKGLMYRTGDLARWQEDGRLEFLGRIDQQVKIRGYRIEPEEVSKVLSGLPGVESAVVTAMTVREDTMLCAYVTAADTLDPEDLRQSLLRELPAYMIPQFIMQIPAIPLTINGKVDKAALPCPERNTVDSTPETPEEVLVCELVGELLGLEKVSPEEAFFRLGGNSLKLMTLRLRLESKTGKAVSLSELYGASSLRAIARHVSGAEKAAQVILPAPKQESYPMTPVQQRLYAIYLADPQGLAYNHPMGIHIRGELDACRLEQAFCALLERHEALRTRFDGKNQYIDAVSFTLPIRSCPGGEPQTLVEDFAAPFRLEEAPLLRAELVELGRKNYLLLVDVHHIAADGISKNVISREVSALYGGEPLAPVKLQYKDYSQFLLNRDQTEGMAFWQRMRDGEPAELIYDKASEKGARRTAACRKVTVSREQSRWIRELCAMQGITPYMFFLSLWSSLIRVYTMKEDVTIGSSFAGRNRFGLEQTVGMFVHTVLLRSCPADTRSFLSYLDEIKELCLQAQSCQEDSEEALREDMASCRLFYAFEDVPAMDFRLGDTVCTVLRPEEGEIPFDMTFLVEDGECYGLGLQYCKALFCEHTAQGILAHLLGMVEAVLRRPEITLGELPLVTGEEQALLKAFNATETEFDREATIAGLFEATVRKHPEKIALVYEEQSYTYEQFNSRANGLAHQLRERGIGEGGMVALLCRNSIERMIAIWGTIKSGAAYVPIEPDFPPERIRDILEDCQPGVLVVFGAEVQTSVPVLDMAELSAYRRDDPIRKGKQTDPLYCIYTSGTTGKPKGVVLSNRGLVNLVNYYRGRLGFTEGDTVLQFASYCFDASVSEMLMALAFGGTLVLIPDDLRRDSRGLRTYCVEKGVTVATFPPNLYAQMEPFPARLILTAGSAAEESTVVRGSQMGGYLNAYGPTENSVCATDWLFTPGATIPNRVPIGKPIDNVKIHILQGQRLCGIGIPGELCIAGESLAMEYLNRPELTREKFIPNPFGEGRLYRTGDLARWLPDGNLDFLGRRDEQVKLRGFRIELQEISACMMNLEGMEQVVVRLVSPEGKTPVLCAYYVSQVSYTGEMLRTLLGKKLPEYMVPGAYVPMDMLPLNTSGKVDTKHLPMPQLGSLGQYLLPQTPVQAAICALFEELLQVSPVGREDDFFLLGGQSLKAMMLMNRMEETFGIRPAFRDIMEHPTPCKLESLLGETKRSYSPIPCVPERESYPASPVQARFYSIQKTKPESVAYNVPFCLKLEGDRSRMASVFNRVFAAHEAFRTGFAVEKGQVVQIIYPFAPISFPERALAEGELVTDALRDFIRPFRLEKAPLARACVVTRGQEAWLLMDMHHSIVDGVSTRLISQEFNALYSGKTVEKPRQYHDYSLWEAAQDRTVQKKFWEEALAGQLPKIQLPYEGDLTGEYEGVVLKKQMSPELTKAVQALARGTGTTEYMLLLAAVMVVLARYSGTEDVVVGSPAANRLHRDTAGMVGMFVNTLLMRGHPRGAGSFTDLLEEVKAFTWKALEYQDYPFDRVVDYLRREKNYDENTFLPVMFSMQEPTKLVLHGEDFRAETVEVSTGEGKFDLAIDVLTEAEGYVFSMDYRKDRLKEASVERFFCHVEQVLRAVSEDPSVKLRDVELLTARERSRILDIFNHTPQHEPRSYLELFARQVNKTPEAVAVVHKETRLSYEELNGRASRLAWELRRVGAKKGDIIPIFSHFDEDMFVGALGIMKAGCAYLPIDPAYPEERIRYMLRDSGARCVVCSQGTVVPVELPKIPLTKESGEGIPSFPVEFAPDCLAYVIYTSGSTGLPKGVMITQRALGNMVQWHNRYYGIKEGDRSCKYASFSFDASVHEMYPQLAAGAQIHIIPEEIRMDMFAINRYLTENQINIGFLPTPICEQFVRLENHTLEKLIAGGDRMTRHSKGYTLYNNYGPTENTVVSTVYEVQGHEKEIPIGKPIDGTRVYILSKERKLQPIGITGELALAGSSLAEGYLHKPELTAERFVDDPFFPGEKMYLTGDLGHWTENGDICYEGRMDNQFKIRGNRVEIGEIEAAAQNAPGVTETCVRVLDGRLVLYTAGCTDEIALRQHLRRSLPEYMIPEGYVFVDKLRYTVNSKPDFDAMPKPQFAKTAAEFAPAANPMEEVLAKIWAEVLQTEPIGRHDNFFELGGNSLRITLLHYAIEEKYPGQLTVGDLFANPTVAAMAKTLTRRLSAKTALKGSLLTLPEGSGGMAAAPMTVAAGDTALLAALAYSLHRCGKCREVNLYLEAEEGFLRSYTFDMTRLETVPQLLLAAEEQGGSPLCAMPGEDTAGSRTAGRQKKLTVLLTPYENRKCMELVLVARDGRACLRDNAKQLTQSALEQLLLVFTKACPVFSKVAAQKPESYPLSSQQSRIYIAQSLLRELNAYNIPMVFSLPARTDVTALCRALKALVERYDIFRTSFFLKNGELRQRVAENVEFEPKVRKHRDFDPTTVAPGEPFDLSQAPLLRAEVVQADSGVYLLAETHHIIFDGASLDILRPELVKLYHGQSLPPVKLQYPACCLWKQTRQEDEDYWKERFSQGVPTLELPTDKPRSKERSYLCAVEVLELDEALTDRLQRLAAEQGTTEFALFTAAAHILFGRYCGQQETVLGTAMLGRTQPRLRNVPGMFVNTVPLTAHMELGMTFAQFLKQVSGTLAEAEEHQAYPFADLIRLLKLESDGSRTPLIDVSIAFERSHTGEYPPVELSPHVEKFDMSLRCRRDGKESVLELSYCLDLFRKETARNLLESLKALLEGLNPEETLDALPCLSEGQKDLLAGYNQTNVPYDRSKTVCDLIDTFDGSSKTAVVFEGKKLTYGELLRESRHVAGVLQEMSLGKEEIVGVFLPRGLAMYPAIYGILKAGGAYLPMDPVYPDARLRYMIKDSGLRFVLTTQALAPRLEGICRTILMEDLPNAIYRETTITPGQLAYVIYTSGSSGLPKGVLVEHGSLMNMVLWHQRRFGNSGSDVSTQYAGLGFDATVWEIFPCLAVGATIHVIPESLRLDMEGLNDYYEAHGITISYLPTQICEQFMRLENHSLRILHTAGDKLKHFEKRAYILMNNYGPTENTVVATTSELTTHSWNLPIGKPMDNCQVYVLGQEDVLLPPGARGELCLGGDSLARGYLHREEENQMKFVPNPFGSGRIYRTGDLVRWNGDGELEFLGRNDHQVKIRGNRIECGEIEAVLAELPGVTQCAVIAHTEENGEGYLTAYVCGEIAPDEGVLKAELGKRLPEYMIPAAIMRIPALPLTPNGKLDRAALPKPERKGEKALTLPATAVQKELAGLWKTLLGGEEPGIDQSFFSLGGTSILMISLQREIQEHFGKRISIAELFANPTIEKQERLLVAQKELVLQGLSFPKGAGKSGSRVTFLAAGCAKSLWEMGDEEAFFLSQTAFCYLLSAVTKEKCVPMQGRRGNSFYAGIMDFHGISQFAQAVELAKDTELQALPEHKPGLRVQKQPGQRVPLFIWNDREFQPGDDRADLILRLCLTSEEATLRVDDPRDAHLAAALAQLLQELCKNT